MVLHVQYPRLAGTRTRVLGTMVRHGTPSGTARGTIGLGAKYRAKERGTYRAKYRAKRHAKRGTAAPRHGTMPMIVRCLALGA
jgi:hypothetical protein